MGILSRKDKEPTNPKLIRVMRNIALNDNSTTRRKLYQELLNSIFFVPTPTDIGFDKRTTIYFEKGKDIQLITLKNSEGKLVLPVFTDSKSLRMWKEIR